jgi:Concanavalin A-like lectin/glucanases superfamily/Glycosyl hydrolase family 99
VNVSVITPICEIYIYMKSALRKRSLSTVLAVLIGAILIASLALGRGVLYDQKQQSAYAIASPFYHYDPYFVATGSSYSVKGDDPSLRLTKFTLAAWFKTTKNYSGDAYIVNKGGMGTDSFGQNFNYGLYLDREEHIKAGFETQNSTDYFVISPSSYNDGLWHYAVLSYDGSTLRLYVDGQQVAFKSTSGAIPDNTGTQSLRVGANSLQLDGYFTGSVDEVRIWNRALTTAEVTDAYNTGNFDTTGQLIVMRFGGSGPTFSPVASQLGTFYYPWYGGKDNGYESWSEDDHSPPESWRSNYLPDIDPTNFDPTNELYDSGDPALIKKQLGWMKQAGIQFGVASWFGPESGSDDYMRIIFSTIMPASDNPHPDMKWAMLYEDEGGSDNPSVDTIVGDLNYIQQTYVSKPYYLKIDGKPVIFVYNSDATTDEEALDDLARWKEARTKTGFYVVMLDSHVHVSPLDAGANPADVDSWYRYVPGKYFDQLGSYSASVSAGYWKYDDDPESAEGRDPVQFETAVQRLKVANVPLKLITTWNEYPEGSGVEPATEVIQDDENGFRLQTNTEWKPSTVWIDILGKYF